MSKIADFLRAGCDVTVLFANLHAYLDNLKSDWDVLKYRTEYYETMIKSMLTSLGVPLDKLHFINGTDYELSKEFSLDLYKLAAQVTDHDAQKAGAEVVKQVANPKMSGLLYPLLQALDEEYLHVDAQFGGVDQRKIFVMAEKYLPRLGYKERIHLMNPMVPGLTGDKMSASDPNSKIDLLDSAKQVKAKIAKAFCEPGNVDNNGVLSFTTMCLFNIIELPFVVEREEQYGGTIKFNTKEELIQAFKEEKLYPADLKNAVVYYVNKLLDPIREKCDTPEMKELTKKAYPQDNIQPGKAADVPPFEKLKICVGHVLKVTEHPQSDHLYVEEIDVGEDKPRTIVSGLRKYVTIENFQGKNVLIFANLKPQKMAGVMSEGMVLCGSNEDKSHVELILAPEGSKPGEIITVEGSNAPTPDAAVNISRKNNPWSSCLNDLRVDADCVACYKGNAWMTQAGPCTTQTLKCVTIG